VQLGPRPTVAPEERPASKSPKIKEAQKPPNTDISSEKRLAPKQTVTAEKEQVDEAEDHSEPTRASPPDRATREGF
jgi:hypothetical protein